MRRFAASVAALMFIGAGISPADATTARIGGPCKKLHQVDWIKGVRAQCTWIPSGQGKKGHAVWKALAPAKTTATAKELGLLPSIPKSFDDLASNIEGIAYGAWKRGSDAISSAQPRDIPTVTLVGPTTRFAGFETQTALAGVTRLFSTSTMPGKLFIVAHNNADRAWAAAAVEAEVASSYGELVSSEGGDVTASNCRADSTCPGAKQMTPGGSSTSVLLFGDTALSQPTVADRVGLIAHEMTHSMQAAQGGVDGRGWGSAPRWLVEGGAEWAQIAVTSTSHADYLKLRAKVSDELVRNRSTYDAAWVEKFLRTTDWNAPYENWRWYDVGLRAVEVLTVLGGPDSWMHLFAEVDAGKEFPDAFASIYGSSWDSAVPKIAAAITAGL